MSNDSSDLNPQLQPGPERSVRHRPWRLRLLLAAGALVVAAAWFYVHFWLTRPLGSGPAGPAVPREAFEAIWTDRPVLLVGIGDSVTAGFGASPHRAYFQLLVQNAPDDVNEMQGICLSRVLPNLSTRNIALSGSTSLEHEELLLPKLTVQALETFGIVVMTTGGNDVIHDYGMTPPREGAMYGATFEQARP